MRLLTLTPDYFPSIGGIQLLLKRLVDELVEWEHVVIARGPGGPGLPEVSRRTFLRAGPLSLAELNVRAMLQYRRRWPQIILNGHVTTTPAALTIGHALRVPVVTYLYADELPARPLLTRQAVARSRACIAVSRYTRDLAIGMGARPERVQVVTPGVDPLPRPSPMPAGDPTSTIVTVARLADRYKGHDVVLEAMPTVLQAIPDARWLVVGDGPLRPELERRARDLGLDEARVVFTGLVTAAERDRHLAGADVFVMPSRLPPGGAGGEGFGIVYYEAGLHRVPSVAGAVAGALDAVTHGETGLLVDPTDPGAVAEALVNLLRKPALRRRLGEAAQHRAEAATWARMASEVEHILKDVGRSDYDAP